MFCFVSGSQFRKAQSVSQGQGSQRVAVRRLSQYLTVRKQREVRAGAQLTFTLCSGQDSSPRDGESSHFNEPTLGTSSQMYVEMDLLGNSRSYQVDSQDERAHHTMSDFQPPKFGVK